MLQKIAMMITKAAPEANCLIDAEGCQIIVSFANRPGVEVAALTPMAQRQVKAGAIDEAVLSDLLFTIKRIANYS